MTLRGPLLPLVNAMVAALDVSHSQMLQLLVGEAINRFAAARLLALQAVRDGASDEEAQAVFREHFFTRANEERFEQQQHEARGRASKGGDRMA